MREAGAECASFGRKSFRITNFADPHPLSPLESKISEKRGRGWGQAVEANLFRSVTERYVHRRIWKPPTNADSFLNPRTHFRRVVVQEFVNRSESRSSVHVVQFAVAPEFSYTISMQNDG